MAGCLLVVVGFCLVGPAPFIPCPTIIWVTICGLVVHGLGMAAQLVASFTDALRTSMLVNVLLLLIYSTQYIHGYLNIATGIYLFDIHPHTLYNINYS